MRAIALALALMLGAQSTGCTFIGLAVGANVERPAREIEPERARRSKHVIVTFHDPARAPLEGAVIDVDRKDGIFLVRDDMGGTWTVRFADVASVRLIGRSYAGVGAAIGGGVDLIVIAVLIYASGGIHMR